ncbi:hypothetical protein B0H19DRAFT_1061289 [Mycena capillaripes]|nr:hypothetical protein B0H19DRAFT_1061289 [Mycena capillaripes]
MPKQPHRRLSHRAHPISESRIQLQDTYRLQEAFRTLQTFNDSGVMLTWSREKNDWVKWERPLHVSGHRMLKPVAARSFKQIPVGQFQAPICPHVFPDRSSEMQLCLNMKYQGNVVDYFRCFTHACSFVVIIPPLAKKVFLTTSSQIQDYTAAMDDVYGLIIAHLEDEDDEDEVEIEMQLVPTSSSPPRVQTSSSPPRIPSHLSHLLPAPKSLPASTAQKSAETTSLVASTSGTLQSPALGTTPTKSPLHPRVSHPDDAPNPLIPGQIRPIFNLRVANARANLGMFCKLLNASMNSRFRLVFSPKITSQLYGDQKKGLFFYNPESHPLWNTDITPDVLLPYDPLVYPGCVDRIMNNSEFIDTGIGCIIRELNSTLGVLHEDFHTMKNNSTFCRGCLCVFSNDGYNKHVKNGVCSSHPRLAPATEQIFDVEHLPRLKGHSFPNGYKPPHNGEFIDTPVGIAF